MSCLFALPAVLVLGVDDDSDGPLRVHIETRDLRPSCSGCAGAVVIKDRPSVELVDLPCFGRPTRLVWRKRRVVRSCSGCSTPAILAVRSELAWHAKEVVRSIYDHHDPDLAVEFVERLGSDLQDKSCPIEVRSLGRTLRRWKDQIAAWHRAHVTNGPTEAANNLIKRVKRVAFGFTRFRNYRIRVLLYAGKPNWDLLATLTPR